MYDRVRTALKLSTCGLIFAGYMALASVRGYGSAMLLIPVLICLAMPIGEWLDRRFAPYRVLTRATSILYFCFIPLSVIVLGLLDGVIALVIYIQAHSALHQKSPRNYYHIFLMSFFLLLAACPQSPEPIIGLVMPFFLLSAIWAFLMLRLHIDVTENAGRTVSAIIGEKSGAHAGPITAVGNPLSAGLIFLGTVISAAAMLLTIAIFMFTPRIQAGFLGRGDSLVRVTGLNHTVDLRGGVMVEEDTSAVMRVEFPEEPGGRFGSGLMYWRSTTLPLFNRSQWSRRDLRESYDPAIPELIGSAYRSATREVRRSPRAGKRRVRQMIYIDDAPDQGLPCLDLVQMVRVLDNAPNVSVEWAAGRDFTVLLNKLGTRRLAYEVWSDLLMPTPEQLRAAPDDYAKRLHPRDYELLTHHELLPETQQLVLDITQGRDTVYDKAMAIQQWLGSDRFVYTLDLPSLDTQAAIDIFLNQTRRGHCELFASAMALMLRSLGVPARVVSGFRGGEWNALDQSYTVRANMAHLWVEVLFPEYGWVVFDPSPRTDETITGIRRLRNLASLLSLRSKMFWYQRVVGFDQNLQWTWLRNLSVGIFGSVPGIELPEARRATLRLPSVRMTVIVAVLGAGATALLLLRRMVGPKTSRMPLTPDQHRAVRLFIRVRKIFARAGVNCEGKTAEELGRLLASMPCTAPDALLNALRRYSEVRFGKRPFPPQEYAAVKRQMRAVRFPGK